MGVLCESKLHVCQKRFLSCILMLIGAAGERESDQLFSSEAIGAAAGGPESMTALDLFNIHDLLLIGYYAPMTKGPHLKERTQGPPYETLMPAMGEAKWPSNENSTAYGGLREARKGAVMLANIIKDLHPVKKCHDLSVPSHAIRIITIQTKKM